MFTIRPPPLLLVRPCRSHINVLLMREQHLQYASSCRVPKYPDLPRICGSRPAAAASESEPDVLLADPSLLAALLHVPGKVRLVHAGAEPWASVGWIRSGEHTSELQS